MIKGALTSTFRQGKKRLKTILRALGFLGPQSATISGNSILSHQNGYALVDDSQGHVLRHRGHDRIRLNETGSLIWRLCDGNRTVDDITRLIDATFPEKENRIERDMVRGLQELADIGALCASPGGISLVVPCAAEDAVFAELLLASVNYQTLKPREVIVALSGLSPVNARQWEKRWRALLDPEVPLNVYDVHCPQTAAQNRQRGADNATCRLVSWFDADDLQSAERLARINHQFKDARIQAVFHRYTNYERPRGEEGTRYPEADASAWLEGAELMFNSAWASVRRSVLEEISWCDRNHATPVDFARAVWERHGESRIALLPDYLGCRVSTGICNEHINCGHKLKFLENKLSDYEMRGSAVAHSSNTLLKVSPNRWGDEFRGRIARHEPLTMRILLEHSLTLQPGSVIINSGAHVGDTCLVIARHLIDSGREDVVVYGIDPSRTKLDFIQEVADLNGITNLELMYAAVSDHAGLAKVDSTSPNPGEWQIVEDGEDADVPMIKLDDEFATRCVGLIHLDVEGFEEYAIRGAELIIRKYCPLFMLEIKGDASKTDRLLELGYTQAWAGENNAFMTKAPGQDVTRSTSTA